MSSPLDIFRRIESLLGSFRYEATNLVRSIRAFGLVIGVFLVGTSGYYLFGGGDYTLLECAYMTIITLSTVGYGEIIPVSSSPGMQAFTIALLVLGMGGVLYFASSFTAFIVTGELQDLIKLRRMTRKIDELEDHFVIAGIGNTGEYVLDEILRSQRDCVVIDQNRDRLEDVHDDQEHDFPFLVGDATEDAILKKAGLERAAGLICSLGSDRDNLFVTITARSINPDLKIVARAYEPGAEEKFRMAGATSVIYTNVLGGMRMAAEAMRPSVTTFLDLMMKDHGHYRRIEEFELPADSPLAGRELRDVPIRQHTDALIIAVWEPEDDEYTFNPDSSYELRPGAKLIILTLIEDIDNIRALIRGEAPESPTDDESRSDDTADGAW